MGRMPATATFSYGQRGKRADLSELLHQAYCYILTDFQWYGNMKKNVIDYEEKGV